MKTDKQSETKTDVAVWDDDEQGFHFKAVHYTSEEADHDVQLLLDFEYWQANFKEGCIVVSIFGDLIYPDNRPNQPCIEWILSADFDLDLYLELHPELEDNDDQPTDITEISDGHRVEYLKAAFEKGRCELQDPDVNCIYINDETGLEIEEDDLARVFKYDPAHTSLICDG